MDWSKLREMLTMGDASAAGGAEAPAEGPVAKLAELLGPRLAAQGQNQSGKAWKELQQFGGHVLGYGSHDPGDAGHAGEYATVFRGGKIFHVYRDGTKMKIDDGAIARAFGIKPKVGGIEAVGRGGGRGELALAHGGGNGPGGMAAPAPDSPALAMADTSVPAIPENQIGSSFGPHYTRPPEGGGAVPKSWADLQRLKALGLV